MSCSDAKTFTPLFDPLAASALSRELHHSAQPLTVLQGVLELGLLTSTTTEDYRDVIQRAMEESRRVSSSFDLVRKLLHAHQSAALSTFSVSDLVGAVVMGLRENYKVAGVACEFHPLHAYDSEADLVTAPESAVSTALDLILSGLPRWAKRGGYVKVRVELEGLNVGITIHSRQDAREADGSSAAGFLAAALGLATRLINGAGGGLVASEPEFSVLISLPRTKQNLAIYNSQGIECAHV